MNVTIGIIDQRCNQPEDQECANPIPQDDGSVKYRKYVIRGDGRKIPALYMTRDAAVKAAEAQGYAVIE